jgi:hypothetical protein
MPDLGDEFFSDIKQNFGSIFFPHPLGNFKSDSII